MHLSNDSSTDSHTSTLPADSQTSTPSWHTQVFASDGRFVSGWQDKLPPDLAEYRSLLGQFKDFGGMAKSLKDNMALARSKTDGFVRVPDANATPEERAAFHKALGVPERAEDYGLKAPEKLPQGVQWDETLGQAFASKARELGLTKSQVNELASFHLTQTSEQIESMRANASRFLELERDQLQQRFGNRMDQAVQEAQMLETRRGIPASLVEASRSGAFDPTSENFWGVDALEFARWAAQATGEDRLPTGGSVGGNAVNLADAKDIMTNKANPLYARYWSGDPEATERVTAAYRTGF